MHSALSIDEIIHLICSFLSDSDLFSVALTSRPFKDPALSILWSTTNLESLLRLLPKDSWRAIEPPGDVIVEKREFSQEDWLPAMPYMKWIRRLHIYRDTTESSFLDSFAFSFHAAHLFPNMKQVHFYTMIDLCLPFVRVILSPNLTTITLQCTAVTDMHNPDVIPTLSELGSMCPCMVSFSLRIEPSLRIGEGTPFFLAIREGVSKSVSLWNNIQRLRAPALNAQALCHTAKLPQFVELKICFPPKLKSFLDPTHFAGFDSLRTLWIDDLRLKDVTQILNAFTTKQLGLIQIHPSSATQGEWKEYLVAVSKCTSAATTVELNTSGEVISENLSNSRTPAKVLRPLLVNRNLTVLYLPDCWKFDINDKFIKEIAISLPNIKTLVIGTNVALQSRFRPLLTLKAYLHVFIHCSRINHLGLFIDTDTERIVNTAIEKPIQQHGKGFILSVGNSKVEDPLTLAQFLLPFFYEPVWFPGNGLNSSPSVFDGWKAVSNALKDLMEKRTARIELAQKGI